MTGGQLAQLFQRKRRGLVGDNAAVGDGADRRGAPAMLQRRAFAQDGTRADKHVRAAGWIESLGRPEDQAEMLARHYLSALELDRSADRDAADLARQTRPALQGAGDRALALNAFATAVGYYQAALALWPEDERKRGPTALPAGAGAGRFE
jgi:hypothetical protein